MSKGGGAGKVYFILYLAVLLELLIIIVERDDAEDELKKEAAALAAKKKQIQLIAETILNSLRGSATSLSSTSDQSMIIGDPNEKDGRNFNVRVRVADPMRDKVQDLELHIFRNNSEMTAINIAGDSTKFPYRLEGKDFIYTYNFKPMYGAGEYKLHFDAKTNQIVGVAAQHSPDDTVKIGAVHLTVGELKEVRDGITENIPLRGYIDSLLTGLYENFEANVGSNEFTVNVKENPVDKVEMNPEFTPMQAFAGLELWNRINVKKAPLSGPRGVTMQKIDGPGEIKQVDSVYYWVWKPEATAVGQTYTVHVRGEAHRGGGANDQATTDFPVVVNKMEYANASHYYPENKKHEATPHTLLVFKANQKFKDLDGAYKTELYLNGTKIAEKNEASIEYTPEFMKDEGKTLELKTYFKSTVMKDYTLVDDQSWKITAPPFLAGRQGGGDVEIGSDPVEIVGVLGIPGDFHELGTDHLDVTDDKGIFNTTAKKNKDMKLHFFLQMNTSKASSVIKKKDGEDVNVTVTDPTSGQSGSFMVHVAPKAQQKSGFGGFRGGGGIR